jgi:hypothetical protein
MMRIPATYNWIADSLTVLRAEIAEHEPPGKDGELMPNPERSAAGLVIN